MNFLEEHSDWIKIGLMVIAVAALIIAIVFVITYRYTDLGTVLETRWYYTVDIRHDTTVCVPVSSETCEMEGKNEVCTSHTSIQCHVQTTTICSAGFTGTSLPVVRPLPRCNLSGNYAVDSVWYRVQYQPDDAPAKTANFYDVSFWNKMVSGSVDKFTHDALGNIVSVERVK